MVTASETYVPLVAIGTSYDVKIAPDEAIAAAVAGSTKIELWDLASAQVVGSADFRDGSQLDFAPDGSRIAVVNTSGGCALFAGGTLHEVVRWSGRGLGEGSGPLFGPDGQHCLQTSWRGDLVVRSVTSGAIVFRERERGWMIESVARSPDRTLFAYASANVEGQEVVVRVRRWPFDENGPDDVLRLADGRSFIDAMALDDEGRLAISDGASLAVFDLTGRCIARREARASDAPESVAWSPQGELATATAGADGRGTVAVLGPDLEERWALDLPFACAVAFSNSGVLLAAGSWDAGVVLRRTPSAEDK